MMGNPVRRASASSSASRAGRGGTSSSKYAATRRDKRFMTTPPSPVSQQPVFRQIAQGCRALPRLLVQPRQIEVGVRQTPVRHDRLLVRFDGVVETPPILQCDPQVEPRG